MPKQVAVVAIGGNSLIKEKNYQSVAGQYLAAKGSCHHIADMVEAGWDVAIEYSLAQNRQNEFQARRVKKTAACVVTQVLVDGFADRQDE